MVHGGKCPLGLKCLSDWTLGIHFMNSEKSVADFNSLFYRKVCLQGQSIRGEIT